jgi:hypothetical protein
MAQQFKPFAGEQMAALRKRAESIQGPALEGWKRKLPVQAAMPETSEYTDG